jgi:glutaminase
VCKDLSRDFNLHFLTPPRSARASIRAQYTLAEMSSKRLRRSSERAALDRVGAAATVFVLNGDLVFSAAEVVARRIVHAGDTLKFAIVDLSGVAHIDPSVTPLFLQLQLDLGAAWRQVLFVGLHRHPRFGRALEEGLAMADRPVHLRSFPDLDPAMEWCEERLLKEAGAAVADESVSLEEHGVCLGLSADEFAFLSERAEHRRYKAGELIIRKGDVADGFYLLTKGEVSVTIDLPTGQLKRFSTLSAGMSFGELAVVDRSPRSADVRADREVECYAISIALFDEMGESAPRIKMTMLQNLLRNVSRMVARLNQEVATLAL